MVAPHRVLVTGGSGFMGSNFVLYLLARHPSWQVVNLDRLTYAGNRSNLLEIEGSRRYRFVQGDIRDAALVDQLMDEVEAVVNFSAETHVDRSLLDGHSFLTTNVQGTYVLLEAALRHPNVRRFLHISSDEVYGETAAGCSARETDPLRPRNPYAASKAGADMQCIAFYGAYGLPVIIVRPVNNMGPRQHPEKIIPLFITSALLDQPLPLYGDGRQERDWLFVEDHCRALDLVLQQGQPGEVYNIGAGNHQQNLRLAESILDLLGKPRSLIRFVPDRQGHDRRYSLDSSKLRSLGWSPEHNFSSALEKTVAWYKANRRWWEAVYADPAFRDYYQRQYAERLAQGISYNPTGVPAG